MPGLMDRSQGKIIYSSNFDWREVEVGAYLRRRFDHDLVFEDNLRCAGLAEIWFGSLTRSAPSHMINLLIDEGLGTAIIIGGHLYRGASLGAGQFGHVSIDPGGPRCHCGNLGCWESYASNTATVPLVTPGLSENMGLRIFHKVRPSMFGVLPVVVGALSSLFRARAALQLENLALRHQIGVLQRSVKKRPKLTAADRILWA